MCSSVDGCTDYTTIAAHFCFLDYYVIIARATTLLFNPRWAWPASNKGDGLQPYLAFVLLHHVLTMNIIYISRASNHKA